jgi:hypothetical protein
MDQARRKRVLREACPGCRYNRYNMGKGYSERPGIDAAVTVDACWHVDSLPKYDRKTKKYVCGLNTSAQERRGG